VVVLLVAFTVRRARQKIMRNDDSQR
jgi:hypothetical protein